MSLTRTYRSPADGATRTYDARIPAGWDGAAKLPAVLFLHGKGGSRRDFQRTAYYEGADASGAVLLFWEGRPIADGTLSTYYVDGANGVADESDVLAALDDALAALPVDPSRVHLAGFSQGGKGALLVGLHNTDRFASVFEGAGPTDAFQGQLWAPGFLDFTEAAGGAASAGGAILARWFEQSPRHLARNARNLPLLVSHGTADSVVPDSLAYFPYRNAHHFADLAGFTDARGPRPTLTELRALDGAGYPFETRYPAGIGHELERTVDAAALFGFVAGKSLPTRPSRVVLEAYDAPERRSFWVRLGRTAAPDGERAAVEAQVDSAANEVAVRLSGRAAARLDAASAGLDVSKVLVANVHVPAGARLTLAGPFPATTRVLASGLVLAPGRDVLRADGALVLPGALEGALVVDPSAAPLLASDLLVPALVDASGANGSRYRTDLAFANVSDRALSVEIRLLDGSGASTPIDVLPRTTRALDSPTLFQLLGRPPGVAPLSLRVVAGPEGGLLAAARVSNVLPDGSMFGLSFPVAAASRGTLGVSESGMVLGGSAGHPSRTNLSLFAPFGPASLDVDVEDANGRTLRTVPVELPALGRRQLDDLFAGLDPPNRAVLRVSSGPVAAYGTVIANAATNDPYRSPLLPDASLATRLTVPAVASAPGRNGAYFRSDLFLAAPPSATDHAIPIALTFRPQVGSAVSVETLLAAGSTRVLADVLGTLFPSAVPAAGALEIASPEPIRALAVTRSEAPAGPSSQDLPVVREEDVASPGQRLAFVGLGENATARSNAVLVAQGGAATARLTLFADDGPRGTIDVALAPGEVRQLNSVAALFGTAPVGVATLVVEVSSGRVVAAVARIDNLSNDPAGLAPMPVAP